MASERHIRVLWIAFFCLMGYMSAADAATPNFKLRLAIGSTQLPQRSVDLDFNGATYSEYASVDTYIADPYSSDGLCRDLSCTTSGGTLTESMEIIVSGLHSTTQWEVRYEDSGLGGSPDASDYTNYPAYSGTGNGTFTTSYTGDSRHTEFYIRVLPDPLLLESATPSLFSQDITQVVVDIDVDTASTVYAVMVPRNTAAPGAEQIKAGQTASGAAATASTSTVVASAPFAGQLTLSGFTAQSGDEFDVYVVAEDDDAYLSAVSSPLAIDYPETDDDNDGVPNSVENPRAYQWAVWDNFGSTNTATGTIGGVPFTLTSDATFSRSTGIYGHTEFPAEYGVPNTASIKNTVISSNTLVLDEPIYGISTAFASVGNGSTTVAVQFGTPVQLEWGNAAVNVVNSSRLSAAEGFWITKVTGNIDTFSFDYLANENYANFTFGGFLYSDPDTDLDGIVDSMDPDSDNDGIPDAVENRNSGIDLDADGIDDMYDVDYTLGKDEDQDGVDDDAYTFTNAQNDVDGDGLQNQVDTDSDGDGIDDSDEGIVDTDGDLIPNYLDTDSDGDGIPDATELAVDTDNDTVPDYLDTDSDNDGIPDATELAIDTDNDTIPNYLDTDSDDDGIPDATELLADTDTDTVPNYLDTDSDNDGIPDATELAVDTDNDSIPDYLDTDSDNDGVPDSADSTPILYGASDVDTDGVPDYFDLGGAGYIAGVHVDSSGTPLDTDNDGVNNYVEAYPGVNQAPVFNEIDAVFTQSTLASGFSSRALKVADFDNDGDLDFVATTQSTAPYRVSWFENDGTASFTEYTIIAGSNVEDIWGLDVADVNGDGWVDVVYGGNDDNDIGWIINDASGNPFDTATESYRNVRGVSANVSIGQLSLDDITNDGLADIVVSDTGNAILSYIANDGDDNPFDSNPAVSIATGFDVRPVFTVDIDNDGDMDVISAGNGSGVKLFINNGTSNPFGAANSAQQIIVAANASSEVIYLAASDINLDGLPDIIVSDDGLNEIYYFSLDSNGAYQKTTIASLPLVDGPHSVSLGDIDFDGDIDILMTDYQTDDIVWFKNDSSGQFGNDSAVFVLDYTTGTSTNPLDARLADLNKDGIVDFVSTETAIQKIELYTGSLEQNITVLENTISPANVGARDPDGDDITYTLSGDDAVKFTIDDSGKLVFITPPDFENPTDSGTDNTYEVDVTISDGSESLVATYLMTIINDTTQAAFINGTPEVTAFSPDSVTVNYESNEFASISTLVTTSGATAPTVAQVIAQDTSGNTDWLSASTGNTNAQGQMTTASTGLNQPVTGFTIDIYSVGIDTEGNQSTAVNKISVTYTDNDADGLPDIIDTDDDNDGVPDTVDGTPLLYGDTDTDGDGVPDYFDSQGTGEYADTNGDPSDSDNDGVSDYTEAYPGSNDAPVFEDAGLLSSINFTPNQYATVNNASLDLTGDKVTVAAWINPDTTTSSEIFVKNTNSLASKDVDYALRYRPDGKVRFHVGNGTDYYYCTSDIQLGTGEWRYLLGTFERGVGMRLYFDGIEQAITCENGGDVALTFGTSGTINFARYPYSGDSGGGRQYFAGSLDEFAVWNDVLTQEEVTSIFNNGDYVSTLLSDTGDYTSSTTLEGYWRFVDEGSNTLSDATGNGNTATLIGTPVFETRRMEVSIVEGLTEVGRFLATDLDGQTLTYTVTGTDSAVLSIDENGDLVFDSVPDFDAPGDDGINNGYEVTLQASDGSLSATLPLLITVLIDTDADGIPDASDTDDDNDGVPDTNDGSPIAFGDSDTDGDSVPDYFDVGGAGHSAGVYVDDTGAPLDTDGDGISDYTEAFPGANDRPVYTNITSQVALVSSPDGVVAVTTLNATDADGDTITFSLIGGVDESRFAIDSSTGALSFLNAPSFDSPTDSNADNDYQVTVRASDGSLNNDLEVVVTVQPDTTAPAFQNSTPALNAITTSAVSVDYEIDEEGSVYMLVGTQDAATPSVSDVINGNTAGDSTWIAADSDTVDGSFQASLTGANLAQADGSYVLQIFSVARDLEGNESPAVDVQTFQYIDTDADGIPDATDPDDDNDGVPDADDSSPLAYGADDTDNDGVPDYFDLGGVGFIAGTYVDANGIALDTDGDGISDFIEAFQGSADAPVITSDASVSVDENQTVAITVVATDPDGDTLAYSLSGTDAQLFDIDSSTGTVSFKVAPDFESASDDGADNVHDIIVTATDDSTDTLSDSQTIAITVLNVDEAPAATSQSLSTSEDSPLPITLGGSDAEGDTLTYSVVNTPEHGVLSGTAPNLTYTPVADYFGNDAFTFWVNDGTSDSAEATVTLTINTVNDAPIATNDVATVDEDASVSIDILSNDTDAENSLNNASVLITTAPLNGDITISPSTGTVLYTPDDDFSGNDSFAYQVSDSAGENSNTATATIIVAPINDAPMGINDVVSTEEDIALDAYDLLANDTDIDNALTATSAVILQAPSHAASVSINDGLLSYTPQANFVGNDQLTYTVEDASGALSNETTVFITITGVNDQPVAVDDNVTTDEDSSIVIDILANDSDIEDGLTDPGSVTIVSQPEDGSLSVDPATGKVTYTPDSDFSGSDTFTYLVKDSGLLSPEEPPIDSNMATVKVTVNAVNDAPLAAPDNVTMLEDNEPLVINVLGNDSDVDGTLDASSVSTGTATNGTVYVDSATGRVTYTPATDFFGTDSFTYTVTDNQGLVSNAAMVTIGVTAFNASPIADDLSVEVIDDATVLIALTATDVANESLTFSLLSQPEHGTLTGSGPNLRYTANANYAGPDSFTYTANDGSTDSNVATVNIAVTQTDSDGDGISDGLDAFPNDPNESVDTDGDGIGDNTDTDIDGDGVANDIDAFPTDASESVDTDGDGTGDNTDTDIDGDGIPNDSDSLPADSRIDSDGDGVPDEEDAFPNDANESLDSDGDGVGDNADSFPTDATESSDADGDGVGDNTDAFPNDAAESADTDGDGIGDVQDLDADNDGVRDEQDPFPLDATRSSDMDGDGIDDANDDDLDGDGIPNADDSDSDGNGIEDDVENNNPPVANSDVLDISDNAVVTIDVLANDTDADNDSLSIVTATTKVGEVSIENGQLTYVAPENFTGSTIINYQISDPYQGTARSVVLVNVTTFDAASPAPLVLPPEDVDVNATGLFTKVDLGVATATDSQGNPLPVSLVDGITYFKPGVNTAYWEAIDENGLRSVTSQEVRVRPLVSFGKDQMVTEGNEASVKVLLNGASPTYPLSIDYAVSGSSDATDHTLTSGTLIIESGTSGSVHFAASNDALTEPDETIIVQFSGELNSVSNATHEIVITETPQAPEVTLTALQGGDRRLRVARDQGTVSLQTILSNATVGDTFRYTWQVEGAMQDQDSIEAFFTFDPSMVDEGVYLMSVVVDPIDTQTPSVTQSIELAVFDTLEILSTDGDMDNDNIPDNDEGYTDADSDGIPDYADAIAESNVLPSFSGISSGYLVEGEPGVSLRIGRRSILSRQDGALVSESAIEEVDQEATNLGGLFDFEIRGLPELGQSTNIVLPQQRAIVNDALFRKYSVANGWTDYVINADNALSSTPGELGYCPPPNSAVWEDGLNAGDFCIRLTIEDGGPNDADGIANGSIIDPSGMGIVITGNTIPVAADDSVQMLYNTTVTIDVLANDTDADNDPLTIVSASSDFGQADIVSDQIVFTPVQNYFGTVTLDYAIDDGSGVFDYGVVQIEIVVDDTPAGANPVGVSPVAIDDTASTDDRTPITVDVLANDTDADNDSLTLTQANASSGTVVISNNQLVFTPADGSSGSVEISYTVTDTEGLAATGLLTVEVTPYVTISVRNSSGGSVGFYLGLLLASVWIGRKLRGATLLVLLVSAGLCASAHADNPLGIQQLEDNRLYISLGLSQNQHSTSRSELSNALQRYSGTLTQYDDSDTGGHIGFKQVLRNRWMLSAGYRTFGELDNAWTVDTPDAPQTVQDIQAVMPTMGEGFYAGIGYRKPLFRRVFAQVSLEAQQWKQEFSTTSQAMETLTERRHGVSPALSIGLGAQLSENINVTMDARRLEFDGEAVTSLALNLEWALYGWIRPGNDASEESTTASNHATVMETVVPPVISSALPASPADSLPDSLPESLAEPLAEQSPTTDGSSASRGVAEQNLQDSTGSLDIHFALDSKHLNENDLDAIHKLAKAYRPGKTIQLIGWADAQIAPGTAPEAGKVYNSMLAKARAQTVRAVLIERGIPSAAITVDVQMSAQVDRHARRVEMVIR